MARKIMIALEGKQVPAEFVQVLDIGISNGFAEFEILDGSHNILQLRVIPTEVYKTDELDPITGLKKYFVRFNVAQAILPPDVEKEKDTDLVSTLSRSTKDRKQ